VTLALDHEHITRSPALSPQASRPDSFGVGSPDHDEMTGSANSPEAPYVVHARHLASEFPASAVARARLAQAEMVTGNRISAIQAANSVMELAQAPDRSAVAAATRVLTSLGDDGQAASLIHSSPTAPSLISGLLALQQGEYENADQILRARSDPVSLGARGWLSLRTGDNREAIGLLRQATNLPGAPPSAFTNLGYAFAAAGQWHKAIRTTRHAQSITPGNVEISLNLARFLSLSGDAEAARRVLAHTTDMTRSFRAVRMQIQLEFEISRNDGATLQRMKELQLAQVWNSISIVDRAELDADVHLLQARIDRVPVRSTIETLCTLLEQTEYQSDAIARVISGVMSTTSDAPRLRSIIDRMIDRPPSALLPLEARCAMLELRFDAAIEACSRWLSSDPFDTFAALLLSYLYSDYANDFGAAATAARTGLTTNPHSDMLKNNLAYALARDGSISDAKQALPKEADHPTYLATRGLIALMGGQTELGLSLYDSAAGLATARGDDDLSATILYRKWLAETELQLEPSTGPPETIGMQADTPRRHLLIRMADTLGHR